MGAPPSASKPDKLPGNPPEPPAAEGSAREPTATVIQSGGRKATFRNQDLRPRDFRQPASLGPAHLRKIGLLYEEFVRSLSAQLSLYLRLEASIQITKLESVSYSACIDGLPNPTHLTVFKVEPLNGVCLLDIPPRLGLTIVDRLLGGPAKGVSPNEDLNEIEVALLDQVVEILLKEWCQLWQKTESLRPVVLGHESNGRSLNSLPHDSFMLVLSMEVLLGDCVDRMQLAFPVLTLEPLLPRGGPSGEAAATQPAPQPSPTLWNPGFDEVPVQLSTEWHGLELSARELAGLKSGEVLILGENWFDRVEIHLERQPRFQGRLGTSGEHWAVELTEALKI